MTSSDYKATTAATCTTTTTTTSTTSSTRSSNETNKQQQPPQQQPYLSIEMPKFRLEMIEQQQQSWTNEQLKKWVWQQYQQELFQHLMVALVHDQHDDSRGSGSGSTMQEENQVEEEQDEAKHSSPLVQLHNNHIEQQQQQQQQDVQQRLEILETVSRVQRQYLPAQRPQAVYQALIDGMIQLMHCEYGFIGQVLVGQGCAAEEEGQVALSFQSHGVASQLADVQLLQATHDGTTLLPFTPNLDSLWERVLQTNAVVLTNNNINAQDDNAEAAGTPSSATATPLHNFLGLPVQRHDGTLIGVIGLVNRRRNDGFCAAHVPYLQPFLDAASNVITAHQQVQQHALLVNTLEQKVQERTQKLSLANQRLAHANERVLKASAMRLQLFACMSHEIRTPLNCILGMSGLLLQEGESDKSLTPMQKECMQMIVSSGDLLLTVVNDVLDYSKLETGHVDINPRLINLQETLNALVHSIEMKDIQQQVSIRTDLDPKLPEFVTVDSQRLQQILFNLLGNALKFSNMKKGGVIEFQVELDDQKGPPRERKGYTYTPAEREKQVPLLDNIPSQSELSRSLGSVMDIEDGSEETRHETCQSDKVPGQTQKKSPRCQLHGKPILRFRVKDYGKGIESKDYARIFQPFRQASAETEQVYGGTGLGLTIVATLVHAMGGLISVDSVEGEWAEFVVDLPFYDSFFDIDTAVKELASTTVLIIENNPEESDQLVRTLDRCGVTHQELDSMQSAETIFLNRTTPMPPNQAFVFLVNENLYDDDTFELIANLSTTGLITYGPEYSVRGSSSFHLRSPNKVLPSVLIKSFVDLVQQARRPVSRSNSLASSLPEVHRYELRILVAEDNNINQRVLQRMLSRIGVTDVTMVENGRKALDACLQNDFDVIFMDMQMPVMDGLQACRAIMEAPEIEPKPTVVFATAHVSKSFEAECAEAGGSGFLPKPFNVQDIENCLDRIMYTTWI